MRYIMKGGVWKNSEDEILKAAIMKYGLNQWSRISSLLQRKSAKQCKQRWYEWLDPSIKKTQWTRSEDQKLLQLARVFPSQWRTIAPFVGRTPTQCYERYEKLLDIAQGKSIKQAEDLRKLRPGEIDPNPQTKPARLDPIDMDEDEKQMLAEVRVRLANTKGKKAKRKEREKIIEQARRLAQLQKIRELDMAGVDNIPTAKQIKRMKQKKTINYNAEIPFKRDAPQFVYGTEETQTPKNTAFASTIAIQTLEGKRRDVQEQLQRKLDKRRMKKYKQRDLKAMLLIKAQVQKPSVFPISLPQPQINQQDLEQMKKLNITTPLNSHLLSYTPAVTPQHKILYSAQVNLSLNHQQDIDPDAVDKLQHLRKLEQQKQVRSIDRVISERMKTPLNDWQSTPSKLQHLFSNLKKPQNIVQFEIPEQAEEEEELQNEIVMDAEQVEAQQREDEKKRRQQQLKLQSSVIQKELPRPKIVPTAVKPSCTASEKQPLKKKIQQMLENQILSLIYSDAIDHPLEGTLFPDNPPPYKQYLSLSQLEDANKIVEQELAVISKQKKFKRSETRKYLKLDYTHKQAKIAHKAISSQSIIEDYESYKLNIEFYKDNLKQTEVGEKKMKRLLQGYEKIIRLKIDEINQLQSQHKQMQQQQQVYTLLLSQQAQAINSRLSQIQDYYKLIYNSL